MNLLEMTNATVGSISDVWRLRSRVCAQQCRHITTANSDVCAPGSGMTGGKGSDGKGKEGHDLVTSATVTVFDVRPFGRLESFTTSILPTVYRSHFLRDAERRSVPI
jgi:hypothetical protein